MNSPKYSRIFNSRWRLLLLPLLALPACSGETEHPPATPPAEASWSQQISAVREGRSNQIIVTHQAIDATQFVELADSCDGLLILEIESAGVHDEDLAVLEHCPHLKRLKLGAPVGDTGTEHIAAVPSLEIVNLPEARFTDDGLASLARLPRLELLRFHTPNVTDAGMAHIPEIKSLRFLHLIDVPITDTGLRPLYSMTELESFYLDGSQCTEDGLGDLLRALPELHFHKDQLHLPGDPHADEH
jgi:hypothetical protein